jgi:hypothetical protein
VPLIDLDGDPISANFPAEIRAPETPVSGRISCRTTVEPSFDGITFAAVNYYVKQSFSKDAAPELIEQIARENDIVLTAIGDCGSRCSCCLREAVARKAGHSIGPDHHD